MIFSYRVSGSRRSLTIFATLQILVLQLLTIMHIVLWLKQEYLGSSLP